MLWDSQIGPPDSLLFHGQLGSISSRSFADKHIRAVHPPAITKVVSAASAVQKQETARSRAYV